VFVKQLGLGECQRFDNRINDVVDWVSVAQEEGVNGVSGKKNEGHFYFCDNFGKVDQIAYFSLLNSDEA